MVIPLKPQMLVDLSVDLEINERFLECFLLRKGIPSNRWGQTVPPVCTSGDLEVLGSVVIRVPALEVTVT